MSELHKDSKVDCGEHGLVKPAFVCQHLVNWTGKGFNVPDDPPDPDWPFKNAWCDECERLVASVGEWNDETEGFAGIR